METEHCARCGRPTLVSGHITSGREGYGGGFVPSHCRGYTLLEVVGLSGGFHTCVSCGHVWATLDPVKLRAFIETYGDELARQQLDEFDRGPYRDLPDTTLAREVADKVAAVDASARRGKPETARTYRELSGVTWDQALKDTGRWSRLTRAEKLALFGWILKEKKAPIDELW